MATVTVQGASGSILVPFPSVASAPLAQSLANQISSLIQAGVLATPPYNTIPTLPLTPGGPLLGEEVIGGNTPSPSAGLVGIPTFYPAFIDNASNPVTAIPVSTGQTAPYSIIGGTGGLTFEGGITTIGGSIYLGGGANTITGFAPAASGAAVPPNSTNGGLQGNWIIRTVGGAAGSNAIYLSSGTDQVITGANDTVYAGGANVAVGSTNTGNVATTMYLGSGNAVFFGGTESGDRVFGNNGATGNAAVTLGGGGGGIAFASGGNSTLVGGGPGDFLFGSGAAGSKAALYALGVNQTANATMEGGNSTLVGGAGGDSLYGGAGSDVFYAGSGTNTIWAGTGPDSVIFSAGLTHGAKDLINNFLASTDTLSLVGYSSAPVVTTSGSAPLTLQLSDNTQITFNNVQASQFGLLKITTS